MSVCVYECMSVCVYECMCRHIKPNIEAKYILHAISYFHVAYNISMYMLWVRVPPEAAHFSLGR